MIPKRIVREREEEQLQNDLRNELLAEIDKLYIEKNKEENVALIEYTEKSFKAKDTMTDSLLRDEYIKKVQKINKEFQEKETGIQEKFQKANP